MKKGKVPIYPFGAQRNSNQPERKLRLIESPLDVKLKSLVFFIMQRLNPILLSPYKALPGSLATQPSASDSMPLLGLEAMNGRLVSSSFTVAYIVSMYNLM